MDPMDGLDLRRLPEVGSSTASKRRHIGILRRLHAPFALIVMLPTLLIAVYLFAVASPQYVSETHFVVRGQGTSSTGMLSSLLQSADGAAPATEDTYAVADYVMSRDAVRFLQTAVGVRAIFEDEQADPLSRFPGIFRRGTAEHFYWYYKNHVNADLDSTTGISTLSVRTFHPQDSQRIAAALMIAAEDLINRMNERQRHNTVSSSEHEVADLETRLRAAATAIAAYRNKAALLDPEKQSVPLLRSIDDMRAQLTATRLQIAQTQASAPSSPLLPIYERRVQALEAEISAAGARVTGPGNSLVPELTTFDDLALQRELLEKQLAGATAALQQAKVQADRQQLYIDQIVAPDLPDYAAYPRSLIDTLVVFLSLLGLYAMGRLLVSGAREHQLI